MLLAVQTSRLCRSLGGAKLTGVLHGAPCKAGEAGGAPFPGEGTLAGELPLGAEPMPQNGAALPSLLPVTLGVCPAVLLKLLSRTPEPSQSCSCLQVADFTVDLGQGTGTGSPLQSL